MFFFKCLDAVQEMVEGTPEYQLKRLEEVIISNIGNKEILSRMKEGLSNNIKLDSQDYRYLEFCLNELERQKIFETGIVPEGWLPSDKDSELNQVKEQVAKNQKYIKWGIAAAGDDILKKGKIDL